MFSTDKVVEMIKPKDHSNLKYFSLKQIKESSKNLHDKYLTFNESSMKDYVTEIKEGAQEGANQIFDNLKPAFEKIFRQEYGNSHECIRSDLQNEKLLLQEVFETHRAKIRMKPNGNRNMLN